MSELETFALPDWLQPPVIFIDPSRVNINDLMLSAGRPGVIVRVDGDPRECVQYFPPMWGDGFAYVAGLVSENP